MMGRVRSSLRGLPVLVLSVVLVSGCSGEEGVVDDGTQAAVVDTGRLADAGVTVLSPDSPATAARADVVAALADAGLEVLDDDVASSGPGGLGFDTERTAGLLASPGDGASYVVLVFDEPASAEVFAAAEPTAFDDAALEGRRTALLAGGLVAYAGPAAAPAVRRALQALGAAVAAGSGAEQHTYAGVNQSIPLHA